MAVVMAALLGAWLVMLLAPGTDHARSIRRALVEQPARLLDRVTPGGVLVFVALLVIVGTAMWFEAGDLLGFMSLAAPEFVSWAVTFEIGTLVEAGTALLTLVASRRIGSIRTMAGVALDRLRGRATSRRRRLRRRTTRPAANDDADPVPLRFAA